MQLVKDAVRPISEDTICTASAGTMLEVKIITTQKQC